LPDEPRKPRANQGAQMSAVEWRDERYETAEEFTLALRGVGSNVRFLFPEQARGGDRSAIK